MPLEIASAPFVCWVAFLNAVRNSICFFYVR
jgi:hypothetical protein